jgi:heterodisulfide reductase subunit C
MLHALEKFNVSDCHGCGLCAMVCPVYQQGGKVMQTPHGLAKASQVGAALEREDVFACILCGACDPVCPQDIDLMQMLISMRCSFSDKAIIDLLPAKPADQKGRVVFITDKLLLEDQEKLSSILSRLSACHAVLASDQAQDISAAMQAGQVVSFERVHQFITSLQPVKKIIISDGLLQQLIQSKLPQIPMQSLGELLSSSTAVKQQLNADDFYVMDSQSYHANYEVAVAHYDQLQKTTECQLSRDLHRLAIPAGAPAGNGFDQAAQINWLLQGRTIKRIVAESTADYHLLKQHCTQPVIHIAELLP